MKRGIDVSENNGWVNWDAVKAAGYDFAIIRCTYGRTGVDEMFRRNVHEAGVLLELPVFYDMEDADQYKARRGFAFDPAEMTAMCKAFIDTLGLNCGIYASYHWLTNYIDWRSLGCAVWNAEWGSTDDIKGYMWQYTDSAQIGGKSFDANILYT